MEQTQLVESDSISPLYKIVSLRKEIIRYKNKTSHWLQLASPLSIFAIRMWKLQTMPPTLRDASGQHVELGSSSSQPEFRKE